MADPQLFAFMKDGKIHVTFNDVTFGEATELVEHLIERYLKFAEEEEHIDPRLLLQGFHARILARLKGARTCRQQCVRAPGRN